MHDNAKSRKRDVSRNLSCSKIWKVHRQQLRKILRDPLARNDEKAKAENMLRTGEYDHLEINKLMLAPLIRTRLLLPADRKPRKQRNVIRGR